MAKPAVILDTNVIVSAHLAPQGLERRILDLVLNGQLRLCASEEVLEEYEEVLARPKFSIQTAKLTASLLEIRKNSAIFVVRRRLRAAIDPDDNKFLECAEAANANYLVTGNKRHFPPRWKSTRVVNARELLQEQIPKLRI